MNGKTDFRSLSFRDAEGAIVGLVTIREYSEPDDDGWCTAKYEYLQLPYIKVDGEVRFHKNVSQVGLAKEIFEDVAGEASAP
jgi:hypothetical protein